ncbi:MAG: hypothetical protein ACJ768_05960 [Gaiellaceae bacterium]
MIAGLLSWDLWSSFSHGLGVFRELTLRRDDAERRDDPPTDGDVAFAQFAAEALDGARAAISTLTGGEYRRHRPLDRQRNHPSFTRELIGRTRTELEADSGVGAVEH